MILKPFTTTLYDTMAADASYFPLTERDKARLLALVPEGEEILLTIKDNLYSEWVRAENQCGFIVVHRGIGGSEAHKFPKGACVFFETSLPVIKWLICNHDCCAADDGCPCESVTEAGMTLPVATVNQAWEGTAVFSGDLPMEFGVSGCPSWMSIAQGPNFVKLYGIPPGVGTYTIAVSATNCSGQNITIQQGVVTANSASDTEGISSAQVVLTDTPQPVVLSESKESSARNIKESKKQTKKT